MILKVVKVTAVLKQLMSYVANHTIINNTSTSQGEKKAGFFFQELIVLIVILFAIIR